MDPLAGLAKHTSASAECAVAASSSVVVVLVVVVVVFVATIVIFVAAHSFITSISATTISQSCCPSPNFIAVVATVAEHGGYGYSVMVAKLC